MDSGLSQAVGLRTTPPCVAGLSLSDSRAFQASQKEPQGRVAHFGVWLDVLDLLPNGSARRQSLESEIQTRKSRRLAVSTSHVSVCASVCVCVDDCLSGSLV